MPGNVVKALLLKRVLAIKSTVAGFPPLDEDIVNTGIAVGASRKGLTRTSRIRLLCESAMKRLPSRSTLTPVGKSNDALVARPPSPAKPTLPLPATVVIIPPDTFRIR
jgi:hypothetical protein